MTFLVLRYVSFLLNILAHHPTRRSFALCNCGTLEDCWRSEGGTSTSEGGTSRSQGGTSRSEGTSKSQGTSKSASILGVGRLRSEFFMEDSGGLLGVAFVLRVEF